ncbi:type 2 periplasmic-binding domain-containing protein [Algicola sagamiensis]|uniref:transporter substrate-binding domain-containing protein n=1 Tax=Algicola sagamiensis TaxID=163869 RepID=UPI0003A0E7C6|nr:transporter substrate-binding domain-containing protein [Algicola sagamiensis]
MRLLWVFFLVWPSLGAAEVYRFIVEENPPYVDPYSSGKGVFVEKISDVLVMNDKELELYFDLWQNIPPRLHPEKAITLTYQKDVQLMEKWAFSKPLFILKTGLLTEESTTIHWKHLHDLRGFRIGVTSSVTYGEKFEAFRTHLKIIEAPSDLQNIEAITGKKIDFMVVEKYMLDELLEFIPTTKKNSLRWIGKPLIHEMPVYAICSRNYVGCRQRLTVLEEGLTKDK